MKCPNCTDTTLVMSDRQGIEIDYCPSCRGIWLDRGELDKLLEKAASQTSSTGSMPAHAAPQFRHEPQKVVYVDDHRYHKRKHESWLSDIFD